MDRFRFAPDAVSDGCRRATVIAATGTPARLLARADAGEALRDDELAALLVARVPADELLAVARGRRPPGGAHIETFSPLYITNECDAECLMCGMRGTNDVLLRETADHGTVEGQLDILRARGLRAVAVLSGEYRHGSRRREMIRRAAAAMRAALARGFAHVLINIGALDEIEYDELLAGVPREPDARVSPQLTMCTFQETYDPSIYARFMGENPANPRSDFGRRVTNFDRACEAGMWAANPGILLGLNADLAFELLALLAHIRHLRGRGMAVYVSVPRLRKASGTPHRAGVTDDDLVRIVGLLVLGAPDAKIVISTREPPALQRRLLPVIGVLTPGSPGVAPYTRTGARFDLESSQFEVLDHRPIEAILGEYLEAGATIARYEPPGPA